MQNQMSHKLFQLLAQSDYQKIADYIKHFPLENGRLPILDILNKQGQTPLHWCLVQEPIEEMMPTLLLLIDCGSDVYLRNHQGETVLALIDKINDPHLRSSLKNAIIKSYDERLQQSSFEDEGGKAV